MAAKAAISAVEAATQLAIDAGSERERTLFRELAVSPYARALQYAFFAERQAANLPGVGPKAKLREVKTVGILGAGTMGAGITLAFLNAGFPVTIVETAQEALDKGVARIKDTLSANAKRGRITAAQAADRLAKLTPSLELGDLGQADLIIEAVFENMALKKEVFGKLDKIAKAGAIIATNTSTLDVDAIAAETKRPQDVVGLHFFSPANIMRLLEIVRAEKTADDVMATSMAIAKRIGKVGVQAGVCDGFVGNRMLAAYGGEVQAMSLEGAMPQEIDGAFEGWGMAMGPLAVSDLAGLDVGYRIRKERKLTGEAARNARIPDRIVEMGRHGQKTGAGYYKYDENRKRMVDPEIEALIRAEAEALQIKQRPIPADEIVERSLLRLANEGAKILEEGIALRASDIDTMYLNGYGFPAWRGGPMWQVDNVIGLKTAAERIKAYEAKYGARWKIAPLLEKLAAEGGSFAKLDAKNSRIGARTGSDGAVIDKIMASAAAAVDGIKHGSTVLIGGFGTAGMPIELIEALIAQGAGDLTIVNNNAGNGDTGLAALLKAGRVRKIICSFPRQADSLVSTRSTAPARSSSSSCRRATSPSASAPPAPASAPSSRRPATAPIWPRARRRARSTAAIMCSSTRSTPTSR